MRILFLTNLLPYPLDNGGKIKTYSTLKALSNAGHDIDLLCFTEVEDKNVDIKEIKYSLGCRNIYEIRHKLTTALFRRYMIFVALKSIFSKYSFGLVKYFSTDMKKKIEELLQRNSYDCVYYDHLQLFLYDTIVLSKKNNIKRVLDEHNCEYLIMQRNCMTSSNFLKKIFLGLETVKLKRFELEAIQKVDKVIVLSKEDDEELKKQVKTNLNTTIIPIGVQAPQEEIEYKNDDLFEVSILFVGTLSWAPNNDGLIWFLNNVVPQIEEYCCSFKFTIVGKNPGDELKKIVKDYSNIEITGYVDSVIPYYQKADFMVVPLFVGSGQRVKIIEGFSYGMPIISTSIGAEGLEYMDKNNILIANTKKDFLNAINLMKNGMVRKNLTKNAKETFEKFYSISAVEAKIQNTVLDFEE